MTHRLTHPLSLFTMFLFILFAGSPYSFSQNTDSVTEKQAVMRIINKMVNYYEHRKLSSFMGLFSRKKFPNLIMFRRAVENDFDMNTNITLRKSGERLFVSQGKAVFQANWTKQYRSLLISPHEMRHMKRISGNLRIYLEKGKSGWKIINLQGYPIFGL